MPPRPISWRSSYPPRRDPGSGRTGGARDSDQAGSPPSNSDLVSESSEKYSSDESTVHPALSVIESVSRHVVSSDRLGLSLCRFARRREPDGTATIILLDLDKFNTEAAKSQKASPTQPRDRH